MNKNLYEKKCDEQFRFYPDTRVFLALRHTDIVGLY